jgi:hypothetical protein
MSRGHRRKQVPWCRCCPARRAGCWIASRRRWEARCYGRCGGRSAATLLATQMAAESEEREQRQKGESARRGRTPVKPRQRITTAGEGSRQISCEATRDVATCSEQRGPGGPPVGTCYCSSRRVIPFRPSVARSCGQKKFGRHGRFISEIWSRLSLYLMPM